MRSFYVDNTPYAGHHTGTAQGGSNDPPSITLAAACGESDGAYVDWGLRIVSGTGAGQSRRITAYSSGTNVAVVESQWATLPDATSVYAITFGCDTNMGLYRVLGSGGPFASLSRAMYAVAISDTVYVKAGTPYTWDNGQGMVAKIVSCGISSWPIRVIGYKSQPGDASGICGDDSYRPVIDGGGVLTSLITLDSGVLEYGFLGYEFAHFRFVNAAGAGVVLAGGPAGVAFYDCVAEGNGGHGFELGGMARLEGCEATGNGGCGIAAGAGAHIEGCRVHDNGDHQISASGLVEYCEVYGIPDGKRGIDLKGEGSSTDAVRNCVVDGTLASGTSTGIYFGGSVSAMVNTIVYGCGIGAAQAYTYKITFARNNLYHGNTTSRQNWPADRMGAVTGDPKFVDAGEHDYGLSADSPAAGAGYPASLDLGAHQREAVGGGSPTNVGMQT